MKKIYKNIAKCSFLGALLLLGTTACSDDHFDINPGTATSSNTIWQNIQSTGMTDSLALILDRTIVMSSETDKRGTQHYSEVLNAAQTFTVWAPKDGTYNAKYYLDLLDERDALFAQSEGTSDAANQQAWRINYTVANQFVQNHVARFNYESSLDRQKVRMLNTKVSYYTAGENIFNNIPMVKFEQGSSNIVSSNGSLHILEGISPFSYNIYDYIGSSSDFTTLWDVLTDPDIDKREFYPSLSTPGAMDTDGNMVYVDSAYITTNVYLDGSGALVKSEDSTYIALLPTDAAWDDAVAKVKALYKYGTTYNTDWDADTYHDFKTKGGISISEEYADSIGTLNAKKAIIQSAFFSTTNFPVTDNTDSAQVNYYAQIADSLMSTNREIFFNPNKGGINPNFNGQNPVKVSNGYLYPLTSYNIDPAWTWVTTNSLDMRQHSYYIVYLSGAETPSIITIDENNKNSLIKGEVEDNQYLNININGNSALTVDIRLDNLYSTKYNISAVVVPNDMDTTKVDEKNLFPTPTFRCYLLHDGDAGANPTDPIARTDKLTTSNDSVETKLLFENVEIPKCYNNLSSLGGNSTSTSFVILRFEIPRTYRPSSVKSLNLRKIIVEPVRE